MPAVMLDMLMVVMVAVATEMDVGAASMIGARQTVDCLMHVRHRRRSNHEMSDKQQQRKHSKNGHA
jgi:hypothetical protein